MNRFVIADGLPYLLAHGKTYAVRWDDKGFTVGAEVKLASVPSVTHREMAIKAKCAGRLNSIDVQEQEEQASKQGQEKHEPEGPEDQHTVADMTVEQLKEYAKEHDIDLGDAKKKVDIIAAILNAEDVNSDDSDS